MINSPLTTKTSPFDIRHYLLTSGNDGKQFFYHAHEDLDPLTQPTNKGDTVTFKVPGLSSAELAAIKAEKGTWVLSNSPNTGGSNLVGTIVVASIDPEKKTMKVELAQTLTRNDGGYSFLIVAPPTDPYTTKMTDLWYSWANYYVSQFPNASPPAFSATVSADTDKPADTRILTLASSRPDLAVGMSVTGNGISSLTTILKIVPTAGQQMLYLSAPVPLANGQTATFQVANPQPIAYSNTPGLRTNLIIAGAFGPDAAFARAFGATVYELMSNYSTVPVNHSLLPNAMDVIYEAIGGNVGFLPDNVKGFTAITADVRDLGKSALRGVPNFLTYPDQLKSDADWRLGDWYPSPSVHQDGADYNVYNLDPFVWFVHQALGMSGYGFSFDDDVSDVGAGGSSALTVTYASGPAANPIESQWFPSARWGAVTAKATIAPAPANSPYAGKSILTIEPQGTKVFWQVSANDLKNGLVGAYVSTKAEGIVIPAKTNLSASSDSNALQFVLSQTVTPTKKPISVTFTGYLPSSRSR